MLGEMLKLLLEISILKVGVIRQLSYLRLYLFFFKIYLDTIFLNLRFFCEIYELLIHFAS